MSQDTHRKINFRGKTLLRQKMTLFAAIVQFFRVNGIIFCAKKTWVDLFLQKKKIFLLQKNSFFVSKAYFFLLEASFL